MKQTEGLTIQAHTVQGQVCDLLLLWMSNADALYHIKSASGWSFTNVVEKVMSIFNLALNCVALSRAKMSKLAEKWLKNCSSMKAIRAQAEKHPQLRTEIETSLNPAIKILDDLFTQLSLKDKRFQVFHTNVADLLKVGNILKKLNPHLGVEGPWATVNVTQKFPQVLQAIKCHFLKQRYYFNAVFKCIPGSDNHCGICTDPVSSKEFLIELRTKLLLPDPEPDKNRQGKFAQYEDCKQNGENTSEKYLPSLTESQKVSLTGLTSQTARGYVNCISCSKPRVYYSARRLSVDEQKYLQIALDSIDFQCGSGIISDTHPNSGVAALYKKVMTNTSLSCWNHIEYPYYSKSGSPFPLVCCWCGGPLTSDDLNARQEKLKGIATCLPLCSVDSCVKKGWQTRGKKRALAKKQSSKSSKKSRIASQKKRKSTSSSVRGRKKRGVGS